MENLKEKVRDFWEDASCGESLYLLGFDKEDYYSQSESRYELEPEILTFAEFSKFKGRKTLEVGVGLGADHQKLAEAGALLTGIDITLRAINHTRRRLELFGLSGSSSELLVADAENLPFESDLFDAVYSWGVIHHSPDTCRAVSEVFRVLKPGGTAKIMIYHKYSIIGFMLWVRYGFLKLRPFISLDKIYYKYLESPGTKAYSKKQAKSLFGDFIINSISTPLTHADLLTSNVGQRHKGFFLFWAKRLWPRNLLKKWLPNNGLFMMIDLEKPAV